MGEQVLSATRTGQPQLIKHFTLVGLSRITRVEIDHAVIDILSIFTILHLQPSNLLLIKLPFVTNNFAASETTNWNNHFLKLFV